MKTYQLTDSQLGIYLDAMKDEGTLVYNGPYLLKIPAGVDRARATQAFLDTFVAHPIYSATFVAGPNGPEMRIPDSGEVTPRGVSAASDFMTPFDLEHGPLWRVVPMDEGILFELHHLVFDGTSIQNIVAEVAARYAGCAPVSEEATLLDKVAEEALYPGSSAIAADRDWFENRFGGNEIECGINPDPDLNETGVGIVESVIDGEGLSVAEVTALAKANGVTPNAILMAAYGYAVAEFNGAESGIFTISSHGRSDARYRAAHGMFVRTLPILVAKPKDGTTMDFVRRVQADFREERVHEAYPFVNLAKDYALSERFSFNYSMKLFDPVELDGKICETVRLGEEFESGDLTCMVWPDITRTRFRLSVTYRKDVYLEETVRNFLAAVVAVFTDFVKDVALSEVQLCSTSARAKIDAANATEMPYDHAQTVIGLFREQAKEHPDKIALVFLDHRHTYSELDRLTDAIAARLIAAGVGRNKMVGILIPRSDWITICSLAVLKARSGYLPLDTTYPDDRLNLMLNDSAAPILITTPELSARIGADYKGLRIFIDDLKASPVTDSSSLVPPTPDDLFVMLYTSGTTGVPKGSVLDHSNMMAFTAQAFKLTDITADTKWATYASFGFDTNLSDMFPTLAGGGELHVIPEENRLDLEWVRDYFNANGITNTDLTTKVGREFAQLDDVRTLKMLIVGGEKLVPLDPPPYRMLNAYGPSECTCYASVFELDRKRKEIPIGKAHRNLKFYVCDREGRLLPPNATGELWIAGPQVCRGYLNRPEKTAEVFIANPFDTSADYARVYRTGDIVKMREDGTVMFVGRKDGQVKVRGFRIELTEVEEVIRRFPQVKDATVQAFDDPNGGKFVAAYVTGEDKIDISALNEFIRSEKPPYMVPEVTMQIDAIPLNQNQKVNKRALPKPERQVEDLTPPQNDVQRQIFDIVAGALGHSSLGIDTDIYDAGLTSLGVVRLNVKLGKAFGCSVRIKDIRANSTVRKLEAFLTGNAASAAPAVSVAEDRDYPITKTQMGIFIECMSNPGSTVYNIPDLVKLAPGVDTDRLARALTAAIDAHPYVKIHLKQDAEGNVRALRRDAAAVNVKVVEGPLPELKALVRPFDLLGGDLYRIEVYRTGEGNYLFTDFLHIISDGTSSGVFSAAVECAYAGGMPEKESYSGFDAALEEEAALKTDALATAKTYFTETFGGIETDNLPTADSETTEGVLGRGLFRSALTVSDVTAFCRKYSVSENAFFNAAFGFTLAKYLGREDAVYTTVYNGRGDSRTENAISMFVKTLPVKFAPEKGARVADLVADIGDQIVESMANDLYSFADISHDFGIRANVLFVFQGEGFDATKVGGEPCEPISLGLDRPKAQMQIEVTVKDGAYDFHCEFDSGNYTEAFVTGMAESVATVAAQFLMRETLDEVDMLSADQLKLLDSFNCTEVSYDRTKTVVEIFREQAKAHSDHPAVVHLGTTLTYREVDEQSDRIAAFLNAKGIGKGDFVSILIPRCVWMTTASLGVLKSGAAYQPLDPSYPPERLEFMVADAGVKLVIADETLLTRIPGYKGPVVTLKDLSKLSAFPDYKPQPLALSDAFIILYTSGSTGKPKGAVLEHGNLIAFCACHCKAIGLDGDSRSAAYASYGFDADMMDQYPVLIAGGTIHIIDESIRLDLAKIDEYFNANGITHSFMTTQVGRQYAQMATAPTLKWLGVGGEALVPLEPPKGFRFSNIYGPTETTVYVTAQTVDRFYKHMPIGRPVENMRAYVVDEKGRRLPPGVPGELWIAGPQVSRGYLNNPEKTADAFGTNPFAPEGDYSRLYRTGDIVTFRSDGVILFVGRRDGQVKVRGFRIELSEVEEVIRRFPGIKDATVAAFDNPAGGKIVVAYVVGDAKIDITELNTFIGSEKPPYMVPAVTMQIEKIPLNQNQKVNKRALPKPELKIEERIGAEPETDLEKKLCEMIAAVLGVGKVYADDDFFALGGDSIRAMGFAAKAKSLGVKTAMVMKRRTPRAIAEAIEGKNEKGNVKSEKVEMSVEKKDTVKTPLNAFERSMYFEQMRNPASQAYCMAFGLTFTGVEADRLAVAFRSVAAAHEAMHSHYAEEKGVPVRVDDGVLPEVEIRSASSIDEAMRDSQTLPKMNNLAVTPFRAIVYRLPGETAVLAFSAHHIAFDGTSFGVITNELFAALGGNPPAKCEVDLSTLAAMPQQVSSAFYDEMFKDGVPVNEMPVKGTRPKTHPGEDRKLEIAWSAEEYAAVAAVARGFAVTPFELTFATVGAVIGKYCASEDVVLGVPTNMRPDEAEDAVGMFVNTSAVRLRPGRDRTFADYVSASAETFRTATREAMMPFAEVVAKYAPQHDASRSPIYDVNVNWLPAMFDKAEQDGITLETFDPFGDQAEVGQRCRDFSFTFMTDGKTMSATISWPGELFDDALVANLASQLKLTLSCAGKGGTVREVLALPEAQRMALEAFSVTATAEPDEILLHRMFERAAKANPSKTALIAVDRTLTFAELDAVADAVAANLQARGIGRGDSVVLLLPRTSVYFSAMFGVLKAGAAFIPCDPKYPTDRINHIIADADAKFIVTTPDKVGDYPEGKTLLIDDLARGGGKPSDPGVTGEDLAYMIYTSGSTGKPKGVMLRHAGICNYLRAHPANIHVDIIAREVTVYVSVTTVSFDMSFKEHCGTLVNGKTLVFAGDDEMNDPKALARLIVDNRADAINATPSRLQQYMAYAPFREALGGMKAILSGGEGYPIALRDQLKAVTKAHIINTYGPTEITVSSNCGELTDAAYVNVGRPLLNYREWIVDKFGDLAPFGVTGELYIGGIGVAKGYRNLPEQTAARFVNYEGALVYKSGDLARWDADGNVLIFGRIDSQVKLRGLRIELGEIQGLIAKQPGIEAAVVLVRKLNGQEHLCAYYMADRKIDPSALRDELKKTLTHYMVPTAYLQLEKFPVTPNGKTDFKALPDPEPLRAGEYVAPETDDECKFCAIFAKTLELSEDKVGATDNFFDLGGTSLLATSVVIAAGDAGYPLAYGDIFKSPTPRQLAKLCGKGGSATAERKSMFDFSPYDHERLARLLEHNTLEFYRHGEERPLGDILITGATGYMGIHVLAKFLETENDKAYCLVRKGRYGNAADRLRNMMFYYFGGRYEREFDARVEVIDGDATNPESLKPLVKCGINTVFNCAANVKHFSKGTDIEDVNVGGVKTAIAFCLKAKARLIHFSTTSVAGFTSHDNGKPTMTLDERTLYRGQNLDNKYTGSKMLSELEVFKAIDEQGLVAKVIRVGTLAAREEDGEFQINFLTNSFMGRLRSYALLGKFPYSLYSDQICLGPIDMSARAFLKLAKTPAECRLFHAVNNHTLPLGDIIRAMNADGIPVEFVEDDEFNEALDEASRNPKKANILAAMLAYRNMVGDTSLVPTPVVSDYTTQVLIRSGFFWNESNQVYVMAFINALKGLAFFEHDNLVR